MINYFIKKFGFEKKSKILNFLPENDSLVKYQEILNILIKEKISTNSLIEAKKIEGLKEIIDNIFLLEGFLNDGLNLEKFKTSVHYPELDNLKGERPVEGDILKSSFNRDEKQRYEYVVKNKNNS